MDDLMSDDTNLAEKLAFLLFQQEMAKLPAVNNYPINKLLSDKVLPKLKPDFRR